MTASRFYHFLSMVVVGIVVCIGAFVACRWLFKTTVALALAGGVFWLAYVLTMSAQGM